MPVMLQSHLRWIIKKNARINYTLDVLNRYTPPLRLMEVIFRGNTKSIGVRVRLKTTPTEMAYALLRPSICQLWGSLRPRIRVDRGPLY